MRTTLHTIVTALAFAALLTPLAMAEEAEGKADANAQADPPDRSLKLVDVENPEKRWRVVNDNVMGGRSKGGYDFEDGKLIFAGSTNTNGGGFSSIRAALKKGTLADADGIELRLKGDKRKYMVGFFQGVGFRGLPIVWRATIDHDPAKGWQTVRIPFDKAKPTWLGEPIRGAPALKPANIRQFDFMIYDKKDGAFRLEVDAIRWYAKAAEADGDGGDAGEGENAEAADEPTTMTPAIRRMAEANRWHTAQRAAAPKQLDDAMLEEMVLPWLAERGMTLVRDDDGTLYIATTDGRRLGTFEQYESKILKNSSDAEK